LAGFEVTTEEKEKLVKESLKGYFNEFHRTMLESHYKHSGYALDSGNPYRL
jgi:hypothetical protein